MDKSEKYFDYLFNWIAGWIDIAAGIVTIFAFGQYRPMWDMRFCEWRIYRGIKQIKAKRAKEAERK